jgi:hypothetical protein
MKKCTKCLEIQPLSNFSKNGKKFGTLGYIFSFSNKDFKTIVTQTDYITKSYSNQDKILAMIPKNLHYMC